MCCCTLTKKRRTSLSVSKTSDVLPSTGMKRPRVMTLTGHYQTCVHVCGIVCYHDATQCFASEIQFVYCCSVTLNQCASLIFASTFVELYITMLPISGLHRRNKLFIVTLQCLSIADVLRSAFKDCAILRPTSTFVESCIIMMPVSALHRKYKLFIVAL